MQSMSQEITNAVHVTSLPGSLYVFFIYYYYY